MCVYTWAQLMVCRSKEQIFSSVNVFCNDMDALWIVFPLLFIVGIRLSQLRLVQFASPHQSL